MRRVTKNRSKRPSAKHHPGRWRTRFLVGLGLLAFASAAAGGAWMWRTGLDKRIATGSERLWWETTRMLGLTVQEVLVTGRQEAAPQDILAALAARRDIPILSVDPVEARARLLRLGWVREAHVERRLPDTVFVRLVERRPIAIWQHAGTFTLIDDAGETIGTRGMERYRHLPLVVGADAPDHAAALLALLAAEPELMAQVTVAVRVGQRRWDVQLANGVDVRLPETDTALAWRRVAEMHREHGLLARDILAIDLRTGDRLVVRLRGERQNGEQT